MRTYDVMIGFRLSGEDAAQLETLIQQTGRKKGTLVRELLTKALGDTRLAPARPVPDEVPMT
jgi:predicted DNA-binding protein